MSWLVDRFYRPTIMIGLPANKLQYDDSVDFEISESNIAQGSARSIPGFCLLSGLKACSHHLNSFGGHKMAAGITIEAERIERFAEEFEAYAKNNLSEKDIAAKLDIDAVVPLVQFREEIINELQMLGPFGQGNPEPIFATKGVRLAAPPRRVGAGGDHLKFVITDNTATVRCIGFRFGKIEKKLLGSEYFDIAYQPQINTYNGDRNVEFNVVDINLE